MPPPPELMDDIVGEILLRIPPDDPALLLRASFVCKPWRRLLTDPAFLRQYRAFHGTPPVLGFFCNMDVTARFVPTSAFHPPDPERHNCRVLDCRHGRALLYDYTTGDFLVWDPITGHDQHIPNDIEIVTSYNAAVLCAAADCDHLCCHGGPFLVVLVATYVLDEGTSAWVYSSEAGEWSTPTTVESESDYFVMNLPPVLAGDKIYFICEFGWAILRYDLRDERSLSVIDGRGRHTYGAIVLYPAEDGCLRFAALDDYKLGLWSLEAMDSDGVATWTRRGVIQLDPLVTMPDSTRPPNVIGFANAPVADLVFVSTDAGVFTIELESHKIRKVDDRDSGHRPIFPYTSFVTPDCAVGRLSLPRQQLG